jgi:hypothetical protein
VPVSITQPVSTLATSGAAVGFSAGTETPPSYGPPLQGGRVSLTMAVAVLTKGPSVIVGFEDPVTALLNNTLCPPVLIYPPTGDRYPGKRVHP